MNTQKVVTLSICLLLAAGCAGKGWQPAAANPEVTTLQASSDTQKTVARFLETSPELKTYFDEAYGVAVFSTVGKGAISIGGAYGTGEVFEGDKLIGSASLTQLTYGAALGGQAYSEAIFFENKAALDKFKTGNFELGAQVSAVALKAGISADASYEDGVAIFTITKGGLMYEAAVGGQKFGFDPRAEAKRGN